MMAYLRLECTERLSSIENIIKMKENIIEIKSYQFAIDIVKAELISMLVKIVISIKKSLGRIS